MSTVKCLVHDTGYPIDGRTLVFMQAPGDPVHYQLAAWTLADDVAVRDTLWEKRNPSFPYDSKAAFDDAWEDGQFAADIEGFLLPISQADVVEDW